jgi:hypothetical protein
MGGAGMAGMAGAGMGGAGMAGMGGAGMGGAGMGGAGMGGAGMAGAGMGGAGMAGMGGAGMGGAGMAGMGGAGMGGAGMAGMGGMGGATGPNLFFTEYVEGNMGAADALEILNAGMSAVDLSTCRVLLYQDGSPTADAPFALTGTLAVNGLFVLCSGAITNVTCNGTDTDLSDMTGNDAMALVCTVSGTDVVMDVIGQIDDDPVSGEWGNATNGTGDQTLRRMCTVTTGDRDGTNTFNPATEWLPFMVNTTNGLGVRTCPCPGGNMTCP